MPRQTGRMTVEESQSISTKFLKKYGYFTGYKKGVIHWTNSGSTMGIEVVVHDRKGQMQVYYADFESGEEYEYSINLEATSCHYGGKRWWFLCPFISKGNTCCQRVRELYLAGTLYLGCRHCHNLTYQSCKESRKFDRLFKALGINPMEGYKAIRNKNT